MIFFRLSSRLSHATSSSIYRTPNSIPGPLSRRENIASLRRLPVMALSEHQFSSTQLGRENGNHTTDTNSFNCSGVNCETMTFENVLGIVVPILYGMVVIVGFIGNLLVIIVVVSNKQMRNTTNILIINLAVADILFILICVSMTTVSYSMPMWPFGEVMCKIVQYINFVTAYVSI